MALCVDAVSDNGVGVAPTDSLILVLSKSSTCDFYLIETKDLQSHLSAYEVGLFIAGATTLYCLAFIFNLARKSMGLR